MAVSETGRRKISDSPTCRTVQIYLFWSSAKQDVEEERQMQQTNPNLYHHVLEMRVYNISCHGRFPDYKQREVQNFISRYHNDVVVHFDGS
jgi:hypothetical protein